MNNQDVLYMSCVTKYLNDRFWWQIYVRIRNEEWNTYRRYAEFYEFHCRL